MLGRIPKSYRNLVVIRVDGGICSQIVFVALGLQLEERGFEVRYDLSFFRENGKDLTGRFARNWDMPQAFPGLSLKEASADAISYFRAHFRRRGTCVNSFVPPLYIDGYPERDQAFLSKREKFARLLKPTLDPRLSSVLTSLENGESCAVHARRGDLANGDKAYGSATSISYYRRAMRIVAALRPTTCFYFFSDEPAWVRENLLPLVPDGCSGCVMDVNGSDRGYCDLYLISRCKTVISSIGSLGVFGAALSPCNELLVLSSMRKWCFEGLPNVCCLNDDRRVVGVGVADGISSAMPEVRLHGLGWLIFRLWRKLGQWLCFGAVDIGCPPSASECV